MQNISVPAPVIAGVMRRMPSRALDGGVKILMRQMGRRHARLFQRLSTLDKAVIAIEPTDLPHRFLLTLGSGGPSLAIAGRDLGPVTASIKGTLASLLDMLEGRSDGDTLFFSRDLVLTGDTSAIVGLRNILDGADIQVIGEILSLSGPFAKPAGAALKLAQRFAQRVRGRMEETHQRLHATDVSDADVIAECRALREEVQTLRTRLAKLEARNRLSGKESA